MSTQRPDRLVVVAGTATEVGKTWVTCELIRHLRDGESTVHARKPAQSFSPGAGPTDAELLAVATGTTPETVCPRHRWYEVAMAPPMAADVLGRPPILAADLADEITWPAGVEVGVVELAGGVRSPLASDADCAEFTALVRPDAVLLIADAELGTINSVRLTVDALTAVAPPPVVYLNRFDAGDDLHRRNHDWLRGVDGLQVVVDPAAAVVALGLAGRTGQRPPGGRMVHQKAGESDGDEQVHGRSRTT